jgi:hypothetical protein
MPKDRVGIGRRSELAAGILSTLDRIDVLIGLISWRQKSGAATWIGQA